MLPLRFSVFPWILLFIASCGDKESSGSNTKNDEPQILKYHNQIRVSLGIIPLTWSAELEQHAISWAETLAARGCAMEHSKNSKYGENLFMSSLNQGADPFLDAVKAWESEKVYYSGQILTQDNWSQAGHYTQMVWKNTTQLGCAKVVCSDRLIVVCNYNPAGNVMGQKAY